MSIVRLMIDRDAMLRTELNHVNGSGLQIFAIGPFN
jgi:hypothetical protein